MFWKNSPLHVLVLFASSPPNHPDISQKAGAEAAVIFQNKFISAIDLRKSDQHLVNLVSINQLWNTGKPVICYKQWGKKVVLPIKILPKATR